MSRTVAKDGACSSKDVLSSSKAAEGVSRLLKQYQINSLFRPDSDTKTILKYKGRKINSCNTGLHCVGVHVMFLTL